MSPDLMALKMNQQLIDSAMSFQPTVKSSLTPVSAIKSNVASEIGRAHV